jgi:hypothetical protein
MLHHSSNILSTLWARGVCLLGPSRQLGSRAQPCPSPAAPLVLPAGGRDQPFYRVLPDPDDRPGQGETYVAQENIQPEALRALHRDSSGWCSCTCQLCPVMAAATLKRKAGCSATATLCL